jgi:hypothetical protein
MVDKNGRLLAELVGSRGNDECGDCGLRPPEWASYNLGIFLCTRCGTSLAGV